MVKAENRNKSKDKLSQILKSIIFEMINSSDRPIRRKIKRLNHRLKLKTTPRATPRMTRPTARSWTASTSRVAFSTFRSCKRLSSFWRASARRGRTPMTQSSTPEIKVTPRFVRIQNILDVTYIIFRGKCSLWNQAQVVQLFKCLDLSTTWMLHFSDNLHGGQSRKKHIRGERFEHEESVFGHLLGGQRQVLLRHDAEEKSLDKVQSCGKGKDPGTEPGPEAVEFT